MSPHHRFIDRSQKGSTRAGFSPLDLAWLDSLSSGGVDSSGIEPGDFLLGQEHWPDLGRWWSEAAVAAGRNLEGVDLAASLEERLAWCQGHGFKIACGYGRFSSKMQTSDLDQSRAIVQTAAAKGYYLPPEYISIDRAKTGRSNRRIGLNRTTFIMERKLVSAMVFFNTSRVYRRSYDSHKYISEEVVSRGIRALAVNGGLDTDAPAWKLLLPVQGIIDEQQLESTSAAVRNSHIGLFLQRFLVGAPPVGYQAEPDPRGGTTKHGKPRMRQAIYPQVAALIKKHFELVADGTPLAEGCRLWNKEITAWPKEERRYAVDARSTKKSMHPRAYRRLFDRQDYRGRITFGETRGKWLNEKDYGIQEKVDEKDVLAYDNEELRIVSDELWYRVQARLTEENRGKHGPQSGKPQSLASLMSQLCFCGECGHVFYHDGRQYMNCPNSMRDTCGNWGTVDREAALRAVVEALMEQVLAAPELVERIVALSQAIDANDDDGLASKIKEAERLIAREDRALRLLEQQIRDDEDPDITRRYQEARAEKTRLRAELEALKRRQREARELLSRERVMELLSSFGQVLENAGRGNLDGEEGKHQAFSLIRALTGGRITITFKRLHGRRRAFGQGTFTPTLMEAVRRHGGASTGVDVALPEVEVAFRELPRYARIADEVHRLHHEEGLSMTEVGKRFGTTAGNAWAADAYWHEERGLPIPYKREGVKAKHRQTVA